MKDWIRKLSLKKRPYLLLIMALVLTVVLWLIPFGKWILYPFSLFVTWTHEMLQGLTAEMVNVHFSKLVLFPNADASGTAFIADSSSKLRRVVIAGAGYVGSAVLGGAMLYLKTRKKELLVLRILTAAMAFSLLFYARSLFSFFSLLILTFGLTILIYKAIDPWRSFFYNFLACQICLNALLDVRNLYSGRAGSDAQVVSDALFFPYWFWATIWLLVSLAVFALALYWVVRKERRRLDPAAVGLSREDSGPGKPDDATPKP